MLKMIKPLPADSFCADNFLCTVTGNTDQFIKFKLQFKEGLAFETYPVLYSNFEFGEILCVIGFYLSNQGRFELWINKKMSSEEEMNFIINFLKVIDSTKKDILILKDTIELDFENWVLAKIINNSIVEIDNFSSKEEAIKAQNYHKYKKRDFETEFSVLPIL